jgi:hypothetical protein
MTVSMLLVLQIQTRKNYSQNILYHLITYLIIYTPCRPWTHPTHNAHKAACFQIFAISSQVGAATNRPPPPVLGTTFSPQYKHHLFILLLGWISLHCLQQGSETHRGTWAMQHSCLKSWSCGLWSRVMMSRRTLLSLSLQRNVRCESPVEDWNYKMLS